MHPLRVTLIQTALHWENQQANLALFTEKIAAIAEETDLIVLPEMFSTGFSMKPEALAENTDGPALQAMCDWADQKNAAICGSVIVTENGNFYNRLYFVKPGSDVSIYDKRHLFRMAEEDKHYASGSEKLVVEWRGWKIAPFICYDLRFPVWSRNKWTNGIPDYDLLLYVANWPERRSHPWKSLLVARAIENCSYVIGVNRVGNDGNEIFHSGDSAAIDFKGEVAAQIPNGEEKIITVELSQEKLQEFRTAFPAWRDADDFTISH